jgi:hypothetical protein
MKNYEMIMIFASLLFISCNKHAKVENLLTVEKYKVTYRSIVAMSFTKVDEDAMIFQKLVGDTLVVYEFTRDLKSLYSKQWSFRLDGLNFHDLEIFFGQKNTFLMVPEDFSQLDFNRVFCVKNHETNLVYFCTITKLEKKLKIDIVYYYPLD